MIEIWIAEAENGSVQFDTAPSRSDILNCCEDLEGEIEVYMVTCTEVKRELLFTIMRLSEV